ncbi:hypothetical protein G6F61_014439 [Rhizopus arrhizus]|nr:hypothetical protein G6F61_014439 [Rhizopus arrhizus]
MDIWNWVEKLQGDLRQAGQAQNAHLLNRLAAEVSELRVDLVDALLPEARALGKALDNPWVDVYVGHWALRNRVGNRVEGESALGEAVALTWTPATATSMAPAGCPSAARCAMKRWRASIPAGPASSA